MEEENEAVRPENNLAGFSDRVVAFSLDIALFASGYFLTLRLFFPDYSVWLNPHSEQWVALWTALFLVYQAYSSCEGRASLGKRLMGLRIVDLDNEPLSLGGAVLRSVTYLVSSVLNIGFLWSLFSPSRQCWHDMVAGSVVVADRARTPGMRRALTRVGAFACLAFLAGLAVWNHILAPRYYRIMDVAYANIGMQELARLEKAYHRKYGEYATNVLQLAPLSGAPDLFVRDMANLFDLEYGINIEAAKDHFTIAARAVDDTRTPITYTGS